MNLRYRLWLRQSSCRLLLSCVAGAFAGNAFAADVADNSTEKNVADGKMEVEFDPAMLPGSSSGVIDLSRFARGNAVPPGVYSADGYLNDVWVSRTEIRIAAPSADAAPMPCLSRKLLGQLDLHPDLSPELQTRLDDPQSCVGLGEVIPEAFLTFDLASLRLDVSVPQAYLKRAPRGYVSPDDWDVGVPAALLNYRYNHYRIANEFSQSTSYLSLSGGLNLGPWHFRNDAAVTWQSAVAGESARRQWQNLRTYVQRNLPSWQAQLTIGDTFTDGRVFDSIGIRGVQIATDDRMLPQSQQGYAPEVRGVAETSAKIAVRQNGALIYETTVAPGPFNITDLYPTGYGRDLDVTITEADGRIRSFSVPYAALTQQLRPGTTRFGIAAGQLRNLSGSGEPAVLQGTLQHGFSNLLTGHAGIQGSQGYASVLVGGAFNTRFGAIAADVMHSNAHISGYGTRSGQRIRASYSKTFIPSSTSVSVATYHYSTGGFLSLTDTALAREYASEFDPFAYQTRPGDAADLFPRSRIVPNKRSDSISGINSLTRPRNNFTLSLRQELGDRAGSLYANVSTSDYWDHDGKRTQYQVGYSNGFRRVSFSISAMRTLDVAGRRDNQYFLGINIPLGTGRHAPLLNSSFTHSRGAGSSEQATISGSLGQDYSLSYAATATHGSNGNAGSINLGYRSPHAVISGSYGKGPGYSQSSLDVAGAIVAHSGGVTFGQPTGDTVGIVHAPGATGARVDNSSGARVNRFGYALVPFLTPYALDTVMLDPKGLSLDVQLEETSARVAPHAGAVVMLNFKVSSRHTLVVNSRLPDGSGLPFGTEVFDEKDASVGVVGQGGKMLVRTENPSGKLTVRWQDEHGVGRACSFSYALAPPKSRKAEESLEEIEAVCTPVAASRETMEKASL